MVKKILKKHDKIKGNTPDKMHTKLTNTHLNKKNTSETYKSGLLQAYDEEKRYNRLFEQKLATQYREFRNLKDNHIQMIKFMKILAVLLIVILFSLFMITLS
ncbi:MAG: hypothetical protein ACP5NW_01975 [Candidatus Woesearchaeota archaeon]